MSDWMEQYSAALDIRDAGEQAHKQYIDAYTRLADRTASAAVAAAAGASASTPTTTSTSTTTVGPTPAPNRNTPPGTLSPTPSTPTATPDILQTLRADLANTHRARTTLDTQLSQRTAQLATLQATHAAQTARLAQVARQQSETERRLRDREEEIRAKAKLVTDAQDEMVALQLQLNMAEQRRERVEGENRELVERWMKRMGEEAERVNRDSRWE